MAGNLLILLNIRSRYPSFNTAFKRVADFFLNQSGEVQYITIADVATESGVSQSTVSRFIKELGYPGYKSFQMDMARNTDEGFAELRDTHQYTGYDCVNRGDSAREVCQKVFACNIKALQESLFMLDYAAIGELAERIIGAKRIVFFAMGRSSLAANGFRMRLNRLGLNCVTMTDPHEMVMCSTMIDPEELVIGISAFGRSASVIRNMRISRENGAFVFGITSWRDTPIEQAADRMLYTSVSDMLFCSSEPSCTTNTHFALLDSIYMLVTNSLPKDTLDRLCDGAAALTAERY